MSSPRDVDAVTASAPQQRERDAGQYLASRIEELEAKVIAQSMAIEASRTRELQLHKTIGGLQELLGRSKRRQEEVDCELAEKRECEEALSEKVQALIGETQSLRAQLLQLGMKGDAEQKLHLAAAGQRDEQPQHSDRAVVAFDDTSVARRPHLAVSPPASSIGSSSFAELRQICNASLEGIDGYSPHELKHRLSVTVRALNEAHGVIASLLSVESGTSGAKAALCSRFASGAQGVASLPSRGVVGEHYDALGGKRLRMREAPSKDVPWLVRENAALSLRVAEVEHQLQRAALDRQLGL